MLDLEKMNLRAEKILKGNLLEKYQVSDGNLLASVQLVPKNVGAFNLSLMTGGIKSIQMGYEADKDQQAIIRCLISYTMCRKMEDINVFNYEIYNLINKALNAFTATLGDLPLGRIVTCERPGDPDEYFKELETYAGVELRFFLK